ncbi:MAG: carboxyl transferase domain-containing protein, partial [Clostridia bacterium]
MDTMEKLNLLKQAKAKAALGGGEEKQKKQQSGGSLTARQRAEALLDEGSFIEIGALVSARNGYTAADGVVTGYGTVDGRLVYVYSQDATVMGGAIGEMNVNKICNVFAMAAKMGAPVVGMLDSCGARIGEGVEAQAAMGKIFASVAEVSGVVPNISLVLGNCAGGAALAASMSDFVIINEKTGRLFVNGPTVIESTTGKKAPVDGKGSYGVSGNAHFMGANDAACIETAKLLLSYLPSNNLADAVVLDCGDDLNRTSPALGAIEGEYDMRSVIAEVVDDGVTGLLVEPGRPQDLADALHLLATDPRRASALAARARAEAARRFGVER